MMEHTQTMGQIISKLRKERNMTQKDLAERMNVTDKAVSKWERDLSCPDVGSIPKLARELGVSVETLLCTTPLPRPARPSAADTVLKVVPLAMGTAVVVLSAMEALEVQSGLTMLGIGLFCMGLSRLKED